MKFLVDKCTPYMALEIAWDGWKSPDRDEIPKTDRLNYLSLKKMCLTRVRVVYFSSTGC